MISETAEILKGIQVNGKVKHHVTNFICFGKLTLLHWEELTPLYSMVKFPTAFMEIRSLPLIF